MKAASKYVELPKGSILFYEGDACESVPYLAEGEIKILVGGADENLAQIPLYDFCEGELEHPKYRKRLWASPCHRDRSSAN